MQNEILQYFQSRSIFSNAFNDVHWMEDDNTIKFEWKNADLFFTNYCLLKNESKTLDSDTLSWIREEPDKRKIVTTYNNKIGNLIISQDVSLMIREPMTTNFPDLGDLTVREFKLGSRNKDTNPGIQTLLISEILEFNGLQKTIVDRFAGAVMHLQNGTLWRLENVDGLPISVILVSKIKNGLVNIEFFLTRKKVKDRNFHDKLLDSVLFNLKSAKVIILLMATDQTKEYLELKGFKELTSISYQKLNSK